MQRFDRTSESVHRLFADAALEQPILDTIMQAALDAIVVIDHESRVVAMNNAAEHMFACDRAEMLGKGIYDAMIPHQHRASHHNGIQRYLETGTGPMLHKRVEVTALRKDGTEFPVELTVIPAGTTERPLFVSFIRDITQQKEHEIQVRHESMRSALLISNLTGGVLLEDEDRKVERVNQAFCDMFKLRLRPYELIGADCSTALVGIAPLFKEPQIAMDRITSLIRETRPAKDELVYMADGRILSRDYVPIREGDDSLGHFWYYRDVTEELRTFQRWERLLKLEELNKEIIRLFLQLDDVDLAMNEVMAMTGRLLDVSRVYVFHFRENERLCDNTHEWCADGVAPEIDNLQGLDFDELIPSFFPLLIQDGIIAPYHISELPEDLQGLLAPQDIKSIMHIPIFTDGRLEGFIGYDETRAGRVWLPEEITTARLISESYARALERQRTRDALVKARDNALRSSRLKSQFVANMSHEIRTPMTGIMGMLELLTETELDEIQREFASEAFNSASRLLHIINDILDFSKLEAGQMSLSPEVIDLPDIVREVQHTLLTQANRKKIGLLVDIARDVPHRVVGDATRIRQVLMNFVGNAVKFTNEGHVTIEVRCTSRKADTARIAFAVKDTGIGIDEEKLENIFGSFVQADGTTTRKFGGTGLGLAICRQLVQLMEGEIQVESEPGAGSAFSFQITMPIVSLHRNLSLEDTQSQFEKLRVLIVDEVDTSRYILAQQLSNWGIHTQEAHEVAQLQGMLENNATPENPLDIVFLSCRRNQNLRDTMAFLHEQQKAQRIHQIICITDSEETIPSDDHPGEAYLLRPVDLSQLYNALYAALPQLAVPEEHGTNPALDSDQEASSTARGRILVVEDHPLNVDLVVGTLTKIGLRVDVAMNGQEALDCMAQEDYDLILMDVQMPVMDGMEATRRIRTSNKPWKDVPILALTASVLRDEQEAYLQAGMDDVILKPFSINHLRKTVNHWLECDRAKQ